LDRTESMNIGVVLEHRELDNRWSDFTWRLASVIPGAPEIDDWVEIGRGADWVQYHAATLPLEIFRKETEGYKHNLSLDPPSIYVVLQDDDEGDHDVIPHLASVCPYEAQDYLDSGEVVVDSVAMPEPVMAWLAAFIDKHHVDEPFKKRKRSDFDPRKEGFDKPPPRVTKKWNRPGHE
jgi:hypothetical protein